MYPTSIAQIKTLSALTKFSIKLSEVKLIFN